MPCGLHEREYDLWVPVFLSAGLHLSLMKRLGLGSLLQISAIVMKACWIYTALPCPGTQSLVKSDPWGQRTAEECFYSDHLASLVGGKEFLSLARMHIHKHIKNPFQQRTTLLKPTAFKSHNSRTRRIPIANLLLLPIKIWRMITVRWSSPPRHWGRSVIFRQLCLKQWNQTEAPHS